MEEKTVYFVDGCGCVSNAKVFGLEDSIRRAKFPMATDINGVISAEELSYWVKDNFLPRFVEYMDSGAYPKYTIRDDCVEMTIKKEAEEFVTVIFDEDDLPKIFPFDWHFDTYCRSNKVGLMHRHILREYLFDNEDACVDHINRDTKDNRKCNLRLASKSQNGYNSNTRKNNTSGIMGVTWSSSKNKWRAYICINGKQVHIGYYDKYADAVYARLCKEKDVCGEFAPNKMLFGEYGMSVDHNCHIQHNHMRLNDAIKAYRNLKRLSLTDKGAGHDQALTGVIVQFDLTFSNKAWVEAERYHFLDFVSSQSTMHRITKFDLNSAYNEYVDPRIIDVMKEKVAAYNKLMSAKERDANECAQKYLEILYSNPAGFRITAGMTTNYRQLKTIYAQRRNHRLPEWREFCRWIETLPLSELITGHNAGSEDKEQ